MEELLTEKSDLELINLSKSISSAEEVLIKRYRALTFKVARKYFLVGGDIDDLVQEGTLGLWKAIKEFDESKNSSFFTFARLCIETKIKDAIRATMALNRQMFNSAISINNDDKLIEIPSESNPLEELLDKENYDNFYLQMEKILSKTQFLVLKSYLEGYSYREISEKFNLSTKKIDNELFSAKSKIKKNKDKFIL